jgi:hypothetical protein
MKSALFVSIALLLPQLMMSCVSTNLTGEQKEVLLAFREVYDSYKTDFILDGAQTYTAAEGDTLPAIIRRFYGAGNGYFFPLIILASRDVITDDVIMDIDSLKPGVELKIPNLSRNLNDPDTRQSLKYFLYDVADVYEKKEAAETRDSEKQPAADLKNRLRYQADSL